MRAMANSAYRTRVGRPKKYEGLWSAMNKRVYILGTTLEQLRRIKEDNDFPSDDEAVQYLLQRQSMLLRPASASCSLSLFIAHTLDCKDHMIPQ